MNHSQHDELAQLFAQNMHLAQTNPQVQQREEQRQREPITVEHVTQYQTEEKQANHPIHFISGHYTPTAHIRPDTTSEPSRSPPPPYLESIMPDAMAETLRQHSIDPSALLPTQAQLFLNANYEQRSRLLELWRISPPSYPLEEHLHSGSRQTSLEQEEAEARARYEHKVQQSRFSQEEHMLDTTIVEPISPIREPGEAAWPPAARMRAASIAANVRHQHIVDPEPYMMNGYQQQNQSTDPVYAAAAGLWQAPSYANAVHEQRSAMGNQYGMYEQIRNHADWERMNAEMARQSLGVSRAGVGEGAGDDDMVM